MFACSERKRVIKAFPHLGPI